MSALCYHNQPKKNPINPLLNPYKVCLHVTFIICKLLILSFVRASLKLMNMLVTADELDVNLITYSLIC